MTNESLAADRKSYADAACGFAIGTSTVYCSEREAIMLVAAMAPTLAEAIEVAPGTAFVILDGPLLRIDRVGMASGRDRTFYSGKHKCHGVNRLSPAANCTAVHTYS